MQASHTGANICALLSEALAEWGLTKKDSFIVTDNSTNMIRPVEMMELLHIGCFAHNKSGIASCAETYGHLSVARSN